MGKRKNHVLYFNTYAIPKLLSCQAETKDALLHAINEEFVEAVEVLLDHEESIHIEGQPWVRTTLPSFSK